MNLADDLQRHVTPLKDWEIRPSTRDKFPPDQNGQRWCSRDHWAPIGRFWMDKNVRNRVCGDCQNEDRRAKTRAKRETVMEVS
jgi:hypothetical protein